MKAPPVDGLKDDPSVTVPEIKTFLAPKLGATFVCSDKDLIAMDATAGPTLIGLVMAHHIVKEYGPDALKKLILHIGSTVIRKDKL